MPINSFVSSRVRNLLAATVLAGAAFAPEAFAQDDDTSFITLSANAAIATEYRFRGLSLSNHDPAIQGGFDVSFENGFYVGTWGSSIEPYGGSEFEMDIYGGYTHSFGDITTDIGILAYTYPGSKDTYYLEVYGSVSGTAGIVGWTAGAAYVWDQENTGDQDNIYLYLDGSMPLGDTPLALNGHVAYEDGAFGDGKWDWSIGPSYSFQQFTLSVSYVDTNVSGIGKAAVVGMLSASF
ncbi:MAG: hypothetical protein EP335_06475 [Alphaproteobacteria bacterium]|nr:MAG: hypothetical protein EP335_06475 [Alphaproteobacteria bacterium]